MCVFFSNLLMMMLDFLYFCKLNIKRTKMEKNSKNCNNFAERAYYCGSYTYDFPRNMRNENQLKRK